MSNIKIISNIKTISMRRKSEDDFSEIIPGKLYLSHQGNAMDYDMLEDHNIGAVINVTGKVGTGQQHCHRNFASEAVIFKKVFMKPLVPTVIPNPSGKSDGECVRIFVEDSPSHAGIIVSDTVLDSVVDKIHIAHNKGKAALIHCSAGLSRSPTVTMAYLMKGENKTLREAWELTREGRPSIQPNDAFLQKLVDLENKIHGSNTITVEEMMSGMTGGGKPRCPNGSRRKSDGKCHKTKTQKKKKTIKKKPITKKPTRKNIKKPTKKSKSKTKNKIDRDYKKVRKEIIKILEKEYPMARKNMVKELKPMGIKIVGTKKQIIDFALEYIESGSFEDTKDALLESIWRHRIE